MNKPNFVWDKEKMKDFADLSKEDFLESYSYLTEEEYNNTVEILNAPNMEEFVLKLSNSRVPYGLITVEYNPSGNSYTINIDGKVWSNYLSYYETRHDLTDLITGYELYDRKKRDEILKERKQYDIICHRVCCCQCNDAASDKIYIL